MRTMSVAKIGALIATLAFAGSASALPSLSLNPQGGGVYLVELTIDAAGLSSIQWDITSTSGVPDYLSSAALSFSVPASDAACTVLFGSCAFSATGPFSNPGNPTGFNGSAVFITNPTNALQGAPASGQPFTVGGYVFSNPGSEGTVSIGFNGIVAVGVDGAGNPFTIVPEPATASMLGLGLLGLVFVGRRR